MKEEKEITIYELNSEKQKLEKRKTKLLDSLAKNIDNPKGRIQTELNEIKIKLEKIDEQISEQKLKKVALKNEKRIAELKEKKRILNGKLIFETIAKTTDGSKIKTK